MSYSTFGVECYFVHFNCNFPFIDVAKVLCFYYVFFCYRLKCPFHGKIIPRDEFGLPSNPDDILAESERKHKLAEDELNNICKDVEVAIGKDLGCGKKRKKPDIRKQRYSRLTNLKTVTNTSRKRLESKVLQKGALQRVDEALTAIEKRRNLERFGSNFNYHYEY